MYYAPGRSVTSSSFVRFIITLSLRTSSFRAKLAVQGIEQMYQYCKEKALPCKRVGKLIVATSEDEVARLQTIFERGVANGVKGIELIDSDAIRQVRHGVRAQLTRLLVFAAGTQCARSPSNSVTQHRNC